MAGATYADHGISSFGRIPEQRDIDCCVSQQCLEENKDMMIFSLRFRINWCGVFASRFNFTNQSTQKSYLNGGEHLNIPLKLLQSSSWASDDHENVKNHPKRQVSWKIQILQICDIRYDPKVTHAAASIGMPAPRSGAVMRLMVSRIYDYPHGPVALRCFTDLQEFLLVLVINSINSSDNGLAWRKQLETVVGMPYALYNGQFDPMGGGGRKRAARIWHRVRLDDMAADDELKQYLAVVKRRADGNLSACTCAERKGRVADAEANVDLKMARLTGHWQEGAEEKGGECKTRNALRESNPPVGRG
ncbi:hypothetical protein C8F01DRAFT_1080861 [Mycena amicta]|nr:hypothetical protein C8F01DRAFT_1080861 [Mycena amicta]